MDSSCAKAELNNVPTKIEQAMIEPRVLDTKTSLTRGSTVSYRLGNTPDGLQ
jgi:hypothetical protein